MIMETTITLFTSFQNSLSPEFLTFPFIHLSNIGRVLWNLTLSLSMTTGPKTI